jgi:hypothetical protein
MNIVKRTFKRSGKFIAFKVRTFRGLSKKKKILLSLLMSAVGVGLTALIVWAATSSGTVSNSSITNASGNMTQKRLVRTSDGTLHSFVQTGTQTATCGGVSKSGLLWFFSTDNGTTWTCGDQLSSDTTNLMYASATVDSSDNVYAVYSVAASTAAAANGTFYRKLTKGVGATWTLGAQQTVVAGSASIGYSYAVMEVQGTTRLWIATRYFDGSNYQVSTYYSSDLTAAPTWTISQTSMGTAGNNANMHYPAMVRFGSKIGVIYQAQFPTANMRWRIRDDADGLTSWSPENVVTASSPTAARYTVIADTSGNVYFAWVTGVSVVFNYWNGYVWSANATVSSTASSANGVSLTTDGTNVWVWYQDTTNLTSTLSGNSKLVYKKGYLPYTTNDFDVTATSAIASQDVFDKQWKFATSGSAYTNNTTAAGNTTAADTTMGSAVGDITYFGKLQQFDSLSWVVSTPGVGGAATWEYWNGSTWTALTFTVSASPSFTATGYAAFNAPSDWATTTVNAEGTPYYYIRARVTTVYTTAPIGTQFVSIPNINWNNFLPSPVSNTVYGMWSENAASPIKVRSTGVTVTPSTPNSASTTNIMPYTAAYSSTTVATQPSTQRHLVRTSEGTLHIFVNGQNVAACGAGSTNNGMGLQWLYSTDSGVTWQCGSQLFLDTSTSATLMYASATVDSNDNIYITYSPVNNGASGLFNTYYRKITKGSGSTWTVGTQQTVLSGSGTEGYSYSVMEVEGTSRLWLAARYFDGLNYVVRVYYSDGLTDAPTWSVSQSSFDLANNGAQHIPAMVRYKTSIGIVYSSQVAVPYNNIANQVGIRWRFRNDGDSLTAWSNDSLIDGTTTLSSSALTAISDGTNVYVAYNTNASVYLNMWNGTSWQSTVTVSSSTAITDDFVSLSTDGSQIWVFYNDISNLNTNLPGNRNIVYRKCVFGGGGCGPVTNMMTQYNIYDKYWSFNSSAYLDDTSDMGNITAADGRMVTAVGDIAYFGKLQKYDTIEWSLSTSGVGGQVVWEYWNGSAWKEITKYLGVSNNTFLGSGYISFLTPSDWATTTVNSEVTPYYYVRARTTTAYSTPPVATQVAAISQTNWGTFLPKPISGTIYGIWTENSTSPTRVRLGTLDVSASALTTTATAFSEISPSVVGYTTTTNAQYPTTERKLVRTSDGTLHTFANGQTRLTCGGQTGNNNNGLMWVYSTDDGATWQCGAQLSNDFTNLMYASAAVDSNDNVYVVYSVISDGSNTAWSTYYRKLTKGSGSTWTVGSQQTALDASSGLVAYTFSTIEVEGTSRLWLATRYFDGTNYQVALYYSNGLSANPTWSTSQTALDTPSGATGRHYPVLVKFGTKLGVIYNVAYATATQTRWRWRNDTDDVTSWSGEATVGSGGDNIAAPTFTAVSDSAGRVYYASNNTSSTYFSYWNGTAWSATTTVNVSGSISAFVSLVTDGYNVWVIFPDTTNLTGFAANQQGNQRLAYKKGIAPYSASEFDATPTPMVSYHNVFDKYWSYVSSSYLDDTSDAGNVAVGDIRMVTGVGDIAYFGKLQKYDAVNWETATAGVGGFVVWEYWNGSTWAGITSMQSNSNGNFLGGRGYISFTPPTNWATTTVNSEGTPYYYVRARVTTAYSATPVGTQMDNIPRPYMSSFLPNPVSNKLYGVWTENIGAVPMKVRFGTSDVTTTAANSATYAELKPTITSSALYGGATVTVANATRYSTQRHLVKTSDGTLHAFVQATTAVPCGGSNGIYNTVGLIWAYSTDSGQTWTCGGQLSNDLTNLLYASATVDASDNVYVTYSTDTAGVNAFYGIFYRKLTKGSGATWTLSTQQTIAAGSPTEGYGLATIETDGTRLWVAARYFDNNNYQVSTFYSSDLTDTPTWTVSQRTLDTAGNSSAYHIPTMVRFGTNIGVIYDAQATTNVRWRYRADTDGPTTWNAEATVSSSNPTTATYSAVGDSSGKVYVAMNAGTAVTFTYWNGSVWSTNAAVSAAAYSSGYVSVGIVGTTVYVYYGETTNLTANLPGNHKMVYKKGVSPYATANFDVSSTNIVTWHDIFDKYWKYTALSTTYTDNTTASGNTTGADTALPSALGDIAYFGKLQKYDAISWALSTTGIAGEISWEYWNGSAWKELNGFLGVLGPSFTAANGYITFMPPSDWATTTVNGEGTPYYYLRARAITAFTTPPVSTQNVAIPPISWASAVGNNSDLIYMWTEGGVAPNRIRFSASYFNVAPGSTSSLGPASVVGGGYVASSTPALTFTTNDTNVGDTVRYQLQISTHSDFSSPVVDYTSGLASAGSTTFTIGQAAGSGSYTAGSASQTLSDGAYYWRVKTTDNSGLSSSYVTANGGAVAFNVDATRPTGNAANILMLRAGGGLSVLSNGWTNGTVPYFSWDAGTDNVGGSGIAGYCLYLGTDNTADPSTSKGLLGTSPVSTTGTTCQFIVSTTAIDFSNLAYHGATWLTNSASPYYLTIKAIDSVGNIYTGSTTQFQFRYDNVVPTNVAFLSPASGNFSNVADMSFAWPTSGANTSSDANAGVLGWQYQINSTSGTWQGSTTSTTLGINYIPVSDSTYQLTSLQDGGSIVSGNNTIYFRTVDAAGNFSSDATIRAGVLQYGGSAPVFGQTDSVTITPSTSTTNSFGISWPAATSVNTITHYYYMINTTPPSTLATLQANASTYVDNGTSLTIPTAALTNVNRGSNTIYVVAIDDAATPNYSPTNYISGTFTLNSTSPDNVDNLIASDSSIKSQSLWNVTLTWTAPSYQGAGNLTYLIYRSSDGSTFSQVGTSTGLSYVDSAPSSSAFYYKVVTKDGASALSSGSNAVSITPTGRWTSAPSLESGPTVSSITTKKATIAWTTSRSADSKVQFGTSSGSYSSVEPSNSTQVTGHSLILSGLTPGTTYYYKAKWTDEDGNTGSSSEKTFATEAPPTVKDVSTSSVGLSSAIISFTTTGASSVKIYYGTTTAFGLTKTLSTSVDETAYTAEISGLTDGTKYYYKITTFDSDGSEYDNQVNDFTTLPRPKISDVRVQQVVNTAQSTLLVTWTTNTEVSSIVTYYPENNSGAARDEVNVALTKGQHKMIIGGLLPQTQYIVIVRGRDKVGNEAVSDTQKVNTATDTRPPQISDVHVEGVNTPAVPSSGQESTAQIIVSWNTDEPGTSQVEFGEGSGTTYAQKTQEDSALTNNHLVIISNLSPAKVYHVRADSKDKAGNLANSIDIVSITPKATDNALNLVIDNLQQAFGFLGNIKR